MSLDPMISYQSLAAFLRQRAATHRIQSSDRDELCTRADECEAIAKEFEQKDEAIRRVRLKRVAEAEPRS
jgi:hypothetical protein